ncbi:MULTISPECIES: YggL family protein [Vogesella]|jgi:uncharacterized protein YggL (DUF469 family)|uniref:YggL family protein n=1 Tax=Vogesella TaxID=57739 RepID=UPI00118675EE|nr:YggL family protein [Vogesella urethralis]MEC5206030.1 uncharacterized protein YggL (DUF469 family) [Vogesella perlucida]
MTNPNSPNRLKRLSPRQRKKLRVGEFQELGFTVVATLKEQDDAANDALLNGWLEAVDSHSVSFGGHFSDGQLDGVVFPVNGVKVTEEVKAALVAWLQARADVASVEASDLLDVWHSAW